MCDESEGPQEPSQISQISAAIGRQGNWQTAFIITGKNKWGCFWGGDRLKDLKVNKYNPNKKIKE